MVNSPRCILKLLLIIAIKADSKCAIACTVDKPSVYKSLAAVGAFALSRNITVNRMVFDFVHLRGAKLFRHFISFPGSARLTDPTLPCVFNYAATISGAGRQGRKLPLMNVLHSRHFCDVQGLPSFTPDTISPMLPQAGQIIGGTL